MKDNQISLFKKKYEYRKTINKKSMIQYDLKYTSMFGNGIII